ncbi:PREDICTED: 65-kDa microtubule-associated protein 1-like isoform X1 [Ipomoea nil]|uniref:65-kDa microtubule-associated protein 1-like isoform X1 n=2 Tax=Ipomoea nil TaxID=35883 RepID=UPI00090172E6|nr:PREDICTED: 65-kDa microtubule-associated protein 1-like isoform X1 [Ipomoea nil]
MCNGILVVEKAMEAVDAEDPQPTCGTLLQQLQKLWDEVGESDEERDKMLLELEQECFDVYKRKISCAVKCRAKLLQELADAKDELSSLQASLGEMTCNNGIIPDKTSRTIKEQLAAIEPALEKLWKQKGERVKEFFDVQSQIQKIRNEISGTSDQPESVKVDESDLSQKKLDEFGVQLQELQKEKSERLRKVLEFVSTVQNLCAVLGVDFLSTVSEVHPSLNDSTGTQSKSISNDTLLRLAKTVSVLKEDKQQRLQKLQELGAELIDLWNLMETPEEERSVFDHVTCNVSASIDEVIGPGSLAQDLIQQIAVEVERLDKLKSSRMKEISLERQAELEHIFARAHIEIDTEAAREEIMALTESGNIEPAELLAKMDDQIAKAKEEASSRREILDKIEKWMFACEEECWLDDYNRDKNRYNACRGAHLNLKHAEKARILVSKIPAIVESLVNKTQAWEQDRGTTFTYDGVPLLAMLDEYMMLRHDREEHKRRFREQKMSNCGFSPGQPSTKKANGSSNGAAPSRRLSLRGCYQNGSSRSTNKDGKRDTRPVAPVNYVAISKEGTT